MVYTNNSHIITHDDVVAFAQHLVQDCNISFHPDDDFTNYWDIPEQNAVLYNRLNNECFSVCEKTSADIYQIHYEIQSEHILKTTR